MPGRWAYNLLYRVGAARLSRGWDKGPGPEVVELVESGRLSPSALPVPRAIDLGCGTGANVLYLAEHGFDALGIDFSTTAIQRARRAAHERGLDARFVVCDLTAERVEGVDGRYDVVLIYNTLQDLLGEDRRALARLVKRLTAPGSLVVLWCWYGSRAELPLFAFGGPSRLLPFVVAPDEVEDLFEGFAIDRHSEPPPDSGKACFLLTRL